jgi:hypothetical protein
MKTEKRFNTTKEALDGIPEELIQKHKESKAKYWRCGRDNHFTTECYAKRAEGGEELDKPKLTAINKSKTDGGENEEVIEKKAKTADSRTEPEQ